MAFRFFRKRQKMVIIIMVALMVSFLVGVQGFNLFFSKKPGERTIGTMGGEEVKAREWDRARSDIQLLQDYLALGGGLAMLRARPTEIEFLHLVANEGHAPTAFALLLREAEEADFTVADAEIDGFFAYTLTPAEQESARNRMKSTRKLAWRVSEIRKLTGGLSNSQPPTALARRGVSGCNASTGGATRCPVLYRIAGWQWSRPAPLATWSPAQTRLSTALPRRPTARLSARPPPRATLPRCRP